MKKSIFSYFILAFVLWGSCPTVYGQGIFDLNNQMQLDKIYPKNGLGDMVALNKLPKGRSVAIETPLKYPLSIVTEIITGTVKDEKAKDLSAQVSCL